MTYKCHQPKIVGLSLAWNERYWFKSRIVGACVSCFRKKKNISLFVKNKHDMCTFSQVIKTTISSGHKDGHLDVLDEWSNVVDVDGDNKLLKSFMYLRQSVREVIWFVVILSSYILWKRLRPKDYDLC